jgi:SPX domain protein involved in polyphosphate accumulation
MSYRKEKKFKFTKSEFLKIKDDFHKSGMKTLFSKRKINSIYFDNKNYDIYHDSEEGVLPRKKIRIRWYDKDNEYNKEIKISSHEGRYKFKKKINLENTKNSIKDLTFYDQFYGNLNAVILITYERDYYSFKNLRITFDNNISYTNLKDLKYTNLEENYCVMEIKAEYETSDDYIERIFNHSTSRFSKYCNGINNLNLLNY